MDKMKMKTKQEVPHSGFISSGPCLFASLISLVKRFKSRLFDRELHDLVSGDEPSPWWSRRSRKSETFDRLARLAFGACPALLDLVGEHRFDCDLVVALTVSIIQPI